MKAGIAGAAVICKTVSIRGNSYTVNDDCGGEYHFTGSGEVYVPGGDNNAQITVNGRNLATPHVFGNVPDCAVFLGLADVNGVTFEVKQGDSELNYVSVLYGENGSADEGNPATKTHLEKSNEGTWITDPNNISLKVTVTGGCTVVYEKLPYNQ